MAAKIEVIRNFPRTELLKDGWAKSRLASTIIPARLNPDTERFEETTLPNNLWKEPNTGVIMLKPTPIQAQFWEDDTLKGPAALALPVWDYNSGENSDLFAIEYNNSIQLHRKDSSAALIELLVSLAITAILLEMQSEMKWVMQTKDPLAPNEGWTVWCHPPGIYTDRATDYMLIAFGGRYVLHLRMDGTASLWSNAGTEEVPDWVERTVFQFSAGGVDHNKPFQITIIPWGFEYITFLFSQSNDPRKLVDAGVKSKQTNSFLYEISKHEDPSVIELDVSTNQYIKTKQAKLSVALREVYWQYGFAFAKVRYPSTETLSVLPEQMPEINGYNDPVLQYQGFFGQVPPGGGATSLSSSYTDESNGAWDNTIDTQIVPHFVFNSDPSNMYTPELWSYNIEVEEKTHVPNWTPVDISDKWSQIRFQRTVDADLCTAELRIENDDYDSLFSGWGPIRILIDELPVFDGYIYQKRPTIEYRGSTPVRKAVINTTYSCRDMWLRLNEKYVPDFKFLDGLNLLEVIKAMIKRGGFIDDDIEVEDPGGYIASINFEGFLDPNDQKGINPDGTVGDVLREILKNYSLLPIRVRYVGDVWKIYLAPQYDPETPPTVKFKLGTDLTKSNPERWTDLEYAIQVPEFTIEEPFFNGLIARTAQGSGEGAEGIQAVIPCGKTDSGIEDDTAFWFIGRAKLKIVAPPEITLAQSSQELAKIARVFYDRYSRRKAVLEFRGEWESSIDVDTFIWVIGNDDEGNEVSYGAYRIDTIDVQCDFDFPDKDMRHTYMASYTCVYVGIAEDVENSLLMFTEILP